jgi:hypothetical protein
LITNEDAGRYDRAASESLGAAPTVMPLGWLTAAGGGAGLRLSF